MTRAKHSRKNGRRRQQKNSDRQDADVGSTAAPSRDSTSYHPRDQYRPANITDAVERHVSRATEAEDLLERYLRLLRFGRSTALLIVLTLFVAGAILTCGIAIAVTYAGLRPMEAVGVGLGGSAASVLTVVLAVNRWFRVGVDLLSRAAQTAREDALEASDEGVE